MNIFATSESAVASARALDDVRLRKMIVETAQLLSTAVRIELGVDNRWLYKKIRNPNHPVAVWARRSQYNYLWLLVHGLAMCAEYHYRFGKDHATEDILLRLERYADGMPDARLINSKRKTLPFENCTPYKDVVPTIYAYRLCMVNKWEQDKRPPKWTKRGKPRWYITVKAHWQRDRLKR